MSVETKKIRVRFAPSPTGHLHIGNFRAALFNWLYARHNNGSFLLRIEDTDRARFQPEYIESIMEALSWCGVDYDEKPVIQSERIQEHVQAIDTLLTTNNAYRCYCSQEDIELRRKNSDSYNEMFSFYDGYCKTHEPTEEQKKQPHVVRFKVPRNRKEIVFDDMIRGPISFPTDQFDDFIIARSDGSPIYNLVVVLDDAFMKITHVIRGEDHISNTPKQIMLYEAFGFAVPKFGHLPLILGPSGEKLSKRDAATGVLDYKKNGYLPQALFNYLVRLGWSHGDQEKFSKEELVAYFSLDQVGKKGSIFDTEKLDWLNGVYIRETESSELFTYLNKELHAQLASKLKNWNEQQIVHLIDLYKERVKTLVELLEQLVLLHDGPSSFDEHAVEKWINPETKDFLATFVDLLRTYEPFDAESLTDAMKKLCKELNIKLVALAQPIRIALTGTSASPGIFALLEIVGRQESVRRLTSLLESLSK